jgi:hypothetical protein
MALLTMMLTAQMGNADIRVEKIGQPCRAKQVLGGCIVRDPKSGAEWFAIINMNESSGAELILIDAEHDRAELYHAPAGAGGWAITPAPNDRLVLGTFYDGTFMVFDLEQKRFVQHIRLAREEYIWNLAYGSDGRLYGGTYPGGRLGAFDLATGTAEDCGAPRPRISTCVTSRLLPTAAFYAALAWRSRLLDSMTRGRSSSPLYRRH